MRCQWQDLLRILPPWMRQSVDRLGKADMRELRLRLGMAPELVLGTGSVWLKRPVTGADINHCINMATQYSPWTSESMTDGYITAAGGHRIGLCGRWALHGGSLKSMQAVTSLCIRVARDVDGISGTVGLSGDSLLIIGRPGVGKTTFLRDLIRTVSDRGEGCVAVLDERGELFPSDRDGFCFPPGKRTDVLSACKKSVGLELALRTMGPAVIALDEIANREECMALTHAAWCGVRLLATAHASSREELLHKPLFCPILEGCIFTALITLHSDKTWQKEELRLCC